MLTKLIQVLNLEIKLSDLIDETTSYTSSIISIVFVDKFIYLNVSMNVFKAESAKKLIINGNFYSEYLFFASSNNFSTTFFDVFIDYEF